MLFELRGLRGPATAVPEYIANTFAVLTRGAPTRPSPKLQTLLQFEWAELSHDPLSLVDASFRTWDQTVRGAPDGYNPALQFLNEIIPAELPQWSFIKQLIIPEYPLFGKLSAPKSLVSGPNEEQVDFYLPQADLVIEIDGGSHREQRQFYKDKSRDRFLEQYQIQTLRISTSDLRAKNSAFSRFLRKLGERCEVSPRLIAYRNSMTDRKHRAACLRYDLTAVIRLQIAIIVAISHGQLDLDRSEWKLNVSQDFVDGQGVHWGVAAIEELFDWFALFARLNNSIFTPPKINFGPGGLHFDMRLFSRPDDKICDSDGIVICTSAVQDLPFIGDEKSASSIMRLQDYGVSYLATTQSSASAGKSVSVSDLAELCRRVFGHEQFRPGQETLILNALSGQKSLGLMPTGGGKSLCFQLPALLKTGTTITVVPIKALGRDHCAELEEAGFTGRVVNIDSDMPAAVREKIFSPRILRGEMRFVFVSPERFQVENFRGTIRNLHTRKQLRMFVIDEVHCMSEWGHDFRPSYLTLPGTLRELANDVPVLGLTATASVNVLHDIQAEFQIPDELIAYEMHRSRTELNFSVRKELSTPAQIEVEVGKIQAGLPPDQRPPIHIFARYANGVVGVESYATMLGNSKLGVRVGSFAGTQPDSFSADSAFRRFKNTSISKPEAYDDYKKTVQELWKTGQLDVIVTTKAFGMGVNKSNVRHTFHAGMPSSMEAFYQEAGRAGRDREPAFCHLLLRPEPDDATELFGKLRKQLTPEAIEEVLSTKRDGSKVRRNEGGDFRAQLWFLSQGLISIDAEHALVARLHSIVRKRNSGSFIVRADQISDLLGGAGRLQQTLYRLYQMGLIAPWTITDWGRGDGENASVQAVEVSYYNVSFDEACANVAKRIQAIDGRAADVTKLELLKRGAGDDAHWHSLYRIMLEWVRRKHLDSRLQSTWNLYSKSMEFVPERACEFRDDLEAFFKVDSNAFQLAAIRDVSRDGAIPALMELLSNPGSKSIKEGAALRKLTSQLARLLEGTQDSPGLNLAASCLLLLAEDGPNAEASIRFMAAEPSGALPFWCGRGKSLFSLVASGSPSARDEICEWLLREAPDCKQLLEMHETITYENAPAVAVEAALFDKLAANLAEIV